jgi:hypothetical protein
MNGIEPITDIDKQQIITLFNNNVKGGEICLEGQNVNHDGKEGHWLETNMGIKHNAKHEPDIDISSNITCNISKLSKTELLAKCEENGVKNCKSKTKKDLIKLLEKNSDPPVKAEMITDTYSEELLKEQFALHKSYVNGRINTTIKIGVKVRLPCIPEDISENIVKNILHYKLNDKTSRWDCKKGDLESQKEGKQECKCFTSDGPLSFTPSSEWDVIYFLDARNWLKNDTFILYRISLKRTSTEWKNIKVSKTQTFEDQTKQGHRPRIIWESLHPQIESYCSKVYEGTFYDIFSPLEAME